MSVITAVLGDITKRDVDAIVNGANNAMRGGGGVDGAIHRNGGPAILHDCIERFPDGLATGNAGWTTAGDLPAQWVIHTVGPNYNAGQRDRSLLKSCYRRALEVADELGARSVAFPLISTGVYGWPGRDAIAAAIETIAATDTRVEEARLVAFDREAHEEVRAQLASSTPIRILQGIQVVHQRGYHRVRALSGMSPSGAHWRVAVTTADNLTDYGGCRRRRPHRRRCGFVRQGTRLSGGQATGRPGPLIENLEDVLAVIADARDEIDTYLEAIDVDLD